MKKNLAILILSLEGDGAERVVSILLRELKDDYNITLVLMKNIIDYEIPKEIEVVLLDDEEDDSKALKFAKLPFLAYSYKELCKKYEIDISLSFMNRPNYINVLAKTYGNESVCIISERIAPSKEYESSSLKDSVSRYMIRNLYPKADMIIPNSKGIEEDLIENFSIPTSLIQTIYNPVDLERIDSLKNEECSFPFDYFTYINIGRLHPQKNHKALIEAFYYLNDLDSRLIIIGEGELREELEEFIDNLDLRDRVFLIGRESNPFKYLKRADVFVLSSNYEGFPNVLLEALACETPIISTDCKSGPREILTGKNTTSFHLQRGVEEAKYGILTPVSDVAALSEAMRKMKEDKNLRERYKRFGRMRVKDFDKNKIVEKYKKAIELAFAKNRTMSCAQ